MFMNGTILSAKINEFYVMEANIFDLDEEQTYKAEIVDGLPGLAELVKMKRLALKGKGEVSEEELEAMARQVPEPPKMQPLPIRVVRVKNNKAGFMSLVCDLTSAA